MIGKEVIEGDITFIEACKILGKSERTLSRYIKKKLLNPNKIKTEKGIEYRFDRSEVESLKKPEAIGHMTRQNQKPIKKEEDTLALIKDKNSRIKFLEKQLKVKDKQIANFQDRQRETNILMGQLQNKVLMLEDKSKGKQSDKNYRPGDTTSQVKWQGINGFLRRLFKGCLLYTSPSPRD